MSDPPLTACSKILDFEKTIPQRLNRPLKKTPGLLDGSLFFHSEEASTRSMRGEERKQAAMFSYITLEQRIPAEHPARRIRAMVDRALADLDTDFNDRTIAGNAGAAVNSDRHALCPACGECLLRTFAVSDSFKYPERFD